MTIHTPLITPTAAAAHNRRRAFRAKIAYHHAALHTPPTPVVTHNNLPSPPSAAIPTDTLPTMPPSPDPPLHSLDPTILNIQKRCAAHYNITVHELRSHCRDLRLSHPRHVAVYLCRTLTRSSYPGIGKHFGDRDHTTMLHSYRKICDLIQREPALADEIAFLLEHFAKQERQPTSQPTDIRHAPTMEPAE